MKEGDKITANELIENWNGILGFYNYLIEEGHKIAPILFLVQYIIQQQYSTEIIPGTSHNNLLLSLPKNNYVDYTKTLKVEFNDLTQIVKFDYHNKPRNYRKKLNIDWSIECQATEILDTFEYFLNEHDDWKKIKSIP